MSETKTDIWKFRLANIKDSGKADEIMKLYRAATAANAEWTTWDDEYPRLEFCLSDIENGELFALCDESGSILGAVTLKDTEEELDPLPFRINGKLGNAEISRAAVSPDFACHGIAGVMLGECEKEAAARGYSCVRLLAAEKNIPARRVYMRAGYTEAGGCDIYGNPYVAYEKAVRKIETERLYLREMTYSDCGALYAVLADSDIMRHYPYTFDEARVKNWIAKNIERYRTFGFGLWAVCLADTGEMIGDCGITMQVMNGVIRPEIGYHIRRDKQRMGCASEAARACRDFIFRETPFGEVYSYMMTDNVPSSSVAVKIGMRLRGKYSTDDGEVSYYSVSRRDMLLSDRA